MLRCFPSPVHLSVTAASFLLAQRGRLVVCARGSAVRKRRGGGCDASSRAAAPGSLYILQPRQLSLPLPTPLKGRGGGLTYLYSCPLPTMRNNAISQSGTLRIQKSLVQSLKPDGRMQTWPFLTSSVPLNSFVNLDCATLHFFIFLFILVSAFRRTESRPIDVYSRLASF